MKEIVQTLIKKRAEHNSFANKLRYKEYSGRGRQPRPIKAEIIQHRMGYGRKSFVISRLSGNRLGCYQATSYNEIIDNREARKARYVRELGTHVDDYVKHVPFLIVHENHLEFTEFNSFDPFKHYGKYNFRELLHLFNDFDRVSSNKYDFDIRQNRMEFLYDPETNQKGIVVDWNMRRRIEAEDTEMYAIKCPVYYTYRTEVPGKTKAIICKIPLYEGITFNFDGIPNNTNTEKAKQAQKAFDLYFDHYRSRQQTLRKANTENREATNRIHRARSENNFNQVRPEDAFKVRNVSERRLYLEHFSIQEIIEKMNPEVVNKANFNNTEYELIKFPHPDPNNRFPNCYYLKMINPSTGEVHLEGVGPYQDSNGIKEETVEAALKWRDGDGAVDVKDGSIDRWRTNSKQFDYEIPVAIT